MGEWKSIESAPKDGAVILTKWGRFESGRAVCVNGEWYFADVSKELGQKLTHWAEFPSPPNSSGEK